jgi:uncharacterized protein (TIGR03435 family)
MATASYVCGQEKPATNPAQPADSSQPAKHDYRFEVASIRPTVLTSFPYGDPRLKPQYSPGLYREEAVRLGALVGQAFGIKHGYEIEIPSWMDTEYFTINATPPEGAIKADVPIMLQHLLEDRFALKYHHETRQMAGYQLVAAKSGTKLAKSVGPAPDNPANNSPSAAMPLGPGIEFKNGGPQYTKDARSGQLWFGSTAMWHGRDRTMEALASDLADQFDRPVMDATGLEGEYDYTLTFTPVPRSTGGIVVSPLPPPASPNPTSGGDEASVPMEHPLLRDALREQLGLELRPVKNIPVDVVVIDSATKVPTEN